MPALPGPFELRRLRLRIEADELERFGECEVSGFACGELGVKDPAALDARLNLALGWPCAVTAPPGGAGWRAESKS